jgi:hypothetical protein
MSAKHVTRRASAEPAGQRWLTLMTCGIVGETSPVRCADPCSVSAVITLSDKSLTVSNIFQFVMT